MHVYVFAFLVENTDIFSYFPEGSGFILSNSVSLLGRIEMYQYLAKQYRMTIIH